MAFVAGKGRGHRHHRKYGAEAARGSWEPDEYAFEPEPYELNAAKVLPRASAPASTFLDKLFPITIDSEGKAKIYGLPPVVAYSAASLLVASVLFRAGRYL